uniref:Uncharacterized protein n=1 Tax=Ditylenchus dipsaci TaxID=166011 RepID=A0A915EQ43_9BILA
MATGAIASLANASVLGFRNLCRHYTRFYRFLYHFCPRFGELLFSGGKTWVWVAVTAAYAVCFGFFELPVLFTGTYFAWQFNPHVEQAYKPEDSLVYMNNWSNVHNIAVVVALFSFYSFYAVSSVIKVSTLQSQAVKKNVNQKLIFLQVFIISLTNTIAGTCDILQNLYPFPRLLIIIGTYMWFFSHGIPPVIYLVFNKTIRDGIIRLAQFQSMADVELCIPLNLTCRQDVCEILPELFCFDTDAEDNVIYLKVKSFREMIKVGNIGHLSHEAEGLKIREIVLRNENLWNESPTQYEMEMMDQIYPEIYSTLLSDSEDDSASDSDEDDKEEDETPWAEQQSDDEGEFGPPITEEARDLPNSQGSVILGQISFRCLDENIKTEDEPEGNIEVLNRTATKFAVRIDESHRWRVFAYMNSSYQCTACFNFKISQLLGSKNILLPACQGWPMRVIKQWKQAPHTTWWMEGHNGSLFYSYEQQPWHPAVYNVFGSGVEGLSPGDGVRNMVADYEGSSNAIAYVILALQPDYYHHSSKILDGAPQQAVHFWEFGMTVAKNLIDSRAIFLPDARPENEQFVLELRNKEYSHECNPQNVYPTLADCEHTMSLAYKCTLDRLWNLDPEALDWHNIMND